MARIDPRLWLRIGSGVLLLMGALLVAPTVPLQAQAGATTQITVDSPVGGSLVAASPIDIGGWAVDPAGPGSGVDSVQVYLDGPMGSTAPLLGSTSYGSARPDVAVALGNPAFTDSGFNLLWSPSNV